MRDARWLLVGLVASAVMQAPFTNYAHFASAVAPGDGRAIAWIITWVAHALATGEPLFDANMFFPSRGSLAMIDPMPALGVISAPLWYATGNAMLVYNVMKIAGPALSVWATAKLAYAWTRDELAALVAGIAFGCSSFTMLHNGHIQLTWSAGIPLIVLALDRWWTKPTWPRAALWWAAAVVTALISWYLAVIVAIAAGLWLVWLFVAAWRSDERAGDVTLKAIQLACGGLLAGAVLLPFAAPFFGRGSEAGETLAYAASWQSYLVPHEHTIAGRWLVSQGWANPQGIWGEHSLFVGWLVLALALAGAAFALSSHAREDRGRAAFLITLIAVSASLSLGPSPSGLAPFDLVARLPGASGFRATARFGLLVTLGCALLAGYGLAGLRRSLPRARIALPLAALVLVLAEPYVIDVPGGPPQAERMPDIYTLAVDDGAKAGVALPMYAGETFWFLESDYLLYSTSARFLPLANGFGRWAPDPYLDIARASRTFPSADAAAVMRAYGITHVMLHGARYGPGFGDLLNNVRAASDFSIVATRGDDFLLRVK
jgi:hypothetical protein